jgi:hypothetical protein
MFVSGLAPSSLIHSRTGAVGFPAQLREVAKLLKGLLAENDMTVENSKS